jgi:immune inhibitor A
VLTADHDPCVLLYNLAMYRSNFVAALLILFAVLFALPEGSQGADGSTDRAESGGVNGLAAPLAVEAAYQPSLVDTRTVELLGTDAPGRDLVALTQRLRLKSNAPIPSVVNAFPPDYKEGTRQQFYIADVTRRSYFTATATLRVVTAHAYWYVKDGYNANILWLRQSADYFEQKIYPTDRRVFGSEVSPGVDNDPRITVLIAPVPGVGGYFSNADAYPLIVNPYSNQRDMIYLATLPRPDPADPENYFEATLAHEFQHMIHWNVHRDREVWVDEGTSEIAMYLNGYDPGGVDVAFAINPDTQLNAWDDTTKTTPHYGASYLFLRYLMDRFGGESFIGRLMQSKGMGTAGIDGALKSSGYVQGFDGAFKDWTVANVLNDKQIAGGIYSYSEGGRVQLPRLIRTYPATRSGTVHQYAVDYITLGGNLGSATISFKGDSAARVIAAESHSGASFWYSNRRDSGDATLTREFDLTGTSKATLSFWAWYDIETTFDYAYVEASTDGGDTWNTLKGKYTTTDNPNGTSYGNGWTGVSGTGTRNSPPTWLQESVDLGGYTGKKVLVRFEYITDEGYNRPGLAIDDLRIQEIGYSDNVETDNGWTAEGFIRIGSRIPQKWFVALIEKGSPNRVREMTVGADGTGSIDLAGLSSGFSTRQAILVVAALAPKTTELASYTVTIKRR